MMSRKTFNLTANCGTCDNGDRRAFMQNQTLFCKRDQKRVSVNGLCESYKHNGSPLVNIERRARDKKLSLVIQPDFFNG